MENGVSFLEEITKVYKDYQKYNYQHINSFNKLQRKFGYKEIYDMTIRANNALARSIKYFKENNINYSGDIATNYDRLFMLSCQAYILQKFCDSQYILIDLIGNTEKISTDIVKSFEFRFKTKYAEKFPILYRKQTNYKGKYECMQDKVEAFLKVGDELDNFDPKKDLIKTYDIYFPVLFGNMEKVSKMLYKDEIQAKNAQYVLFHDEVIHMIKTLFEHGKFDHVQKLCDLEKDIIQKDANQFGCNVKIKSYSTE